MELSKRIIEMFNEEGEISSPSEIEFIITEVKKLEDRSYLKDFLVKFERVMQGIRHERDTEQSKSLYNTDERSKQIAKAKHKGLTATLFTLCELREALKKMLPEEKKPLPLELKCPEGMERYSVGDTHYIDGNILYRNDIRVGRIVNIDYSDQAIIYIVHIHGTNEGVTHRIRVFCTNEYKNNERIKNMMR